MLQTTVTENDLNQAINIARVAHKGQFDKAGVDYIEHPLRVMDSVESEEAKIVAVLHDVVEDSELTLEDLIEKGFSSEVVEAISCLTKRKGENYHEFVKRVKSNNLATVVKIADIKDNMNLDRLSEVTEKDIARVEKYKKALEYLQAAS